MFELEHNSDYMNLTFNNKNMLWELTFLVPLVPLVPLIHVMSFQSVLRGGASPASSARRPPGMAGAS